MCLSKLNENLNFNRNQFIKSCLLCLVHVHHWLCRKLNNHEYFIRWNQLRVKLILYVKILLPELLNLFDMVDKFSF